MPKGVPAAGFRKTKNWKSRAGRAKSATAPKKRGRPAKGNANSMSFGYAPDTNETDKQIAARLTERFDVLEMLAQSAIVGDSRALIVSGPAGLGKSYTVEQQLSQWDAEQENHTIIKGYVKTTGLYRKLWNYREAGQVIVFDDADSIFFDDVSLNMLKAVCDTTERRIVSYLSEAKFEDGEGEVIPNSFEFNGTIIFITNLDFDALIDRGHRLAPHLQALISRAHYIDLAMKTKRDYIVRIKQVLEQGMLRDRGLNATQEADVVKFIEKNAERMRELSLRMAIKVGGVRKLNHANWASVATITCCKNG